jgi:hypothetical protein
MKHIWGKLEVNAQLWWERPDHRCDDDIEINLRAM